MLVIDQTNVCLRRLPPKVTLKNEQQILATFVTFELEPCLELGRGTRIDVPSEGLDVLVLLSSLSKEGIDIAGSGRSNAIHVVRVFDSRVASISNKPAQSAMEGFVPQSEAVLKNSKRCAH